MRRRFGVGDAEHVTLEKIAEILVGARSEIGYFNGVGKHVVAVETQQRIAVEQQRRNAADQHHVVSDGAHRARFDDEPGEQRQ